MVRLAVDSLDLEKIAEAVKITGGSRVIVFGSAARGIKKPAKDLDLCVLVKKGKDVLDFQKELRLRLWELKYSWNLPLDIHVFPEDVYARLLMQKDPFIDEVRKGVVVYG